MSEPISLESFAGRVQSEDSAAVELVTGKNAEGKESYAIVVMPASKVKEFRHAISSRDVSLEDFGKVVAKGEGTPPQELLDDAEALLTKM